MSAEDEGLAPDPRTNHKPDTHLRRWGAVYLLVLLFLGSWTGQFFTELASFRSEQHSHDEPFVWSDFLMTFGQSTLENWQSEWLQLVFQAILLLGAKHLIFRVDAEDMERLEAKVDEINRRLGGDPGQNP
ncbi:DUF6766 family protein [Nocardioides sp.]|uniref:DUF6766 family protein n=1 Tax=Nocardioides sp. TaxID=35761 RepID=UPI002C967EF7|nr:DUF6766 family protein [Nocardioides sp.]HSX67818.1 DUF6766 family protein [Nocardioides sp.]